MTNLTGNLRLRPTRIGFLVRPRDMRSIRRFMRLSACLWGGLFNPMIPVCRAIPTAWRGEPIFRTSGADLTQGYIRFFEPDVYVEAQPGLAQECGIDTDSNFGSGRRVVALDDFVVEKNGSTSEFAFGLSIFEAYQELYKTIYQFVTQHERKAVLFEGRSADAPFIEAVSGNFPKDGGIGFLRKAYLDAFNPEIREISAKNWIRAFQSSANNPLDVTQFELDRRSYGSRHRRMFVVDPSSSHDLLDLWNLRQFHSRVLPINVRWLTECRDIMREIVENAYRPHPDNEHGGAIRTVVQFGRSIGSKIVDDVSNSILNGLPSGAWYKQTWYQPIWELALDERIVRSKRAVVQAKSHSLELKVESGTDPWTSFTSLSPGFAQQFSAQTARWVNVIGLDDFLGRSGLALTLPTTTKRLMSTRLRRGMPIIVSREGLVLLLRHKSSREFLRLFKGSQAIMEWLREREIECSPSEAGRITDQVISALGGISGAHILSDIETIQLLDKMSKSVRTHNDGNRVEEYPDRTVHVSNWKGIVNRRKKSLFAQNLSIEAFVKAGALRLGLGVKCPKCEYENWYGLAEIKESLVCERCLGDYDFPQGTFRFDNTPWRYRVMGPFSVPDYAKGAYSTVLALRCLTKGFGLGHNAITYSSNLDLEIEGKSLEVDFACWYAREKTLALDEEPWFVVGETKSFADEAIQTKDLTNLKLVGKTIPGTVLIIGVLKDSLSKKEKRDIGALALWGRVPLADGRWRAPVVVLTGTELAASEDLGHTWEKLGGSRQRLAETAHLQLDNLVTLAEITQQIYLDLPSYSDWLGERMEKKGKMGRNGAFVKKEV